MRVDALVGSFQTYEMTLPNSQKPKQLAFKASKNEEKEIKNFENVSREELVHMPKHVSEALRFQKRPNRKHDRGNGKRFGKSFKEKK